MNKLKDDFFIELTRVVSESVSTFEKVDRIQQLAHHFLKSERSNLYLTDPKDPAILRLHSDRGFIQNLASFKSTENGVFGYVLQNKRPLIIKDITKDYRFEEKNSDDLKDFNSGSCMIFPLITENKILGIMSFFDKENADGFEAGDLEIGLKMTSFVSLLISSRQDVDRAS